MLNYNMLKNLTEEFIRFQKNAALPWDDDDSDDDLDWITSVDTDVNDGIENVLDSNDNHIQEEVGDNSNLISSMARRYNLRSRR
jgi:hypothetical protein